MDKTPIRHKLLISKSGEQTMVSYPEYAEVGMIASGEEITQEVDLDITEEEAKRFRKQAETNAITSDTINVKGMKANK